MPFKSVDVCSNITISVYQGFKMLTNFTFMGFSTNLLYENLECNFNLNVENCHQFFFNLNILPLPPAALICHYESQNIYLHLKEMLFHYTVSD